MKDNINKLKSGRGGVREAGPGKNIGRPKSSDPKKIHSFTLRKSVSKKLDWLVKEQKHGNNKSSYIEQLIEEEYLNCTYTATRPNQVWTRDITNLPAAIMGVFYYLYIITDIYSRKVVAWELHDNQSNDLASQLLNRTYLSEGVGAKEIVLHSDNGSSKKGATLLSTLQHLGVIPLFSRPSVSNDNSYSEALFKTLKYTPIYPPESFDTIDVARAWVLKFVRWYNNEHRDSGIKFT